MRTSSRQEAKPTIRFASPWPVTIACDRYRSSAAVAIVPPQHVNATVSDILMMARTTARYIKCGWRLVVCRVTTHISCFAATPESAGWVERLVRRSAMSEGGSDTRQIDVQASMGFAKDLNPSLYSRYAQDIS